MKKSIDLALTGLFFSMHLLATDTNTLFVTVDEQYRVISDDQSELKERLPANQFPGGNWGIPSNGIQVSLRFDKADYTNGEPILATILVRNISDHTAGYMSIYEDGKDGPVRFFAETHDHDVLLPVHGHSISAMSSDVPVNKQKRFFERFDRDFNLTNGAYFVRAYVMPERRKEYIESTKVQITIGR